MSDTTLRCIWFSFHSTFFVSVLAVLSAKPDIYDEQLFPLSVIRQVRKKMQTDSWLCCQNTKTAIFIISAINDKSHIYTLCVDDTVIEKPREKKAESLSRTFNLIIGKTVTMMQWLSFLTQRSSLDLAHRLSNKQLEISDLNAKIRKLDLELERCKLTDQITATFK